MTSYSNWVVKVLKNAERLISSAGNKGIDSEDLKFYMKRNFGVSEKMIQNHIEELELRSFIKIKENKLVWLKVNKDVV